jgi:hypothetical protein
MKKNIKISLIWTSGIVFAITLLRFIAWLYSPNLIDWTGYGGHPQYETPLQEEIIIALADINLPIPFYLHILRFHLQNSENARIVTLEILRNVGAKANSFCTYEDLVKIGKFHAIELTYPEGNSENPSRKYIKSRINMNSDNLYLNQCSIFTEGYIAVGYSQYLGKSGYYYAIEELYKKYDDGRLELVFLAKQLRLTLG